MSSVCLAMIVKNEEKVIGRCIESFAPLVDGVVLLDTGSVDATLKEAANTCDRLGKPLTASSIPWQDFGHARTELLSMLRQQASYDLALMMDADWVLENNSPHGDDALRILQPGEYQAWHIMIRDGGLEWPLPRITQVDHNWIYIGVVHEYLHSKEFDPDKGVTDHDPVPGLVAIHMSDGGSREGRHHRDAELLKDLNDPRSKFYYAQSLYAIGDFENALTAYKSRASIENAWYEEAYFSMFRAGNCAAHLNRWEEAVGLYMYAWGMREVRIEALCSAVELWRSQKMWPLALKFSEIATEIARAGKGLSDRLFVEKWRWDWGAEWEHATAMAAYPEMREEASRVFRRLLDSGEMPDPYISATELNLQLPGMTRAGS
jgi:tetratricopeptide (TPR) repeat protein